MKKYFNGALAYAVAAMACGVFYREFTKMNGFSGRTVLAHAHVHLFALGTVIYLLIALFSLVCDMKRSKLLSVALTVYNIGISGTPAMMVVRGITEVRGVQLTSAANGAVSGIAGLFHICAAAGIILLISALKKNCTKG